MPPLTTVPVAKSPRDGAPYKLAATSGIAPIAAFGPPTIAPNLPLFAPIARQQPYPPLHPN